MRSSTSTSSSPEEYQAEELAGKDATFKIKLHEVQYKELPELDDDFAKDVSEYDTLDELKDSIRKGIETNHESEADQKVENDPDRPGRGRHEGRDPRRHDPRAASRRVVQDFQYRISQQGLKLEQYLQYMGMTMEQFKEQFREQADKQVKMRLAHGGYRRQGVHRGYRGGVRGRDQRIADAYQMEADKVKSLVDAAAVKKDLAVNKAIDFVKSKANIVAGAAEEKKPAKDHPQDHSRRLPPSRTRSRRKRRPRASNHPAGIRKHWSKRAGTVAQLCRRIGSFVITHTLSKAPRRETRMSLVPYVVEQTARGERSLATSFSRLLNDRIIVLSEDVNSASASVHRGTALYLEGQDPEKDIYFYINSPGGSISDGMAIHDTMNYIKCDVSTICVGMAASMGSFLLASGTKGKRFAPAELGDPHPPAAHRRAGHFRPGYGYQNPR